MLRFALPPAVVSYINGHYVTGLQFMNYLDRIYNSLNMRLVLSWRGQLRTNDDVYLGLDQPIRDRLVKPSGFGRTALAESLVSHGIL